jgi:hypothetical protein
MLLFNSKRIKVHLEYKNNQFDVEVEPYQTMKSLKETVGRIFYPIYMPRIIYGGKEVSENDSAIVGDIFRNKINVSVKVCESEEEKRIPLGKASTRASELRKINADLNRFLDSTNYERPKIKTTSSSLSKWSLRDNPKAYCKCAQAGVYFYCFNCQDFFCNICNLQHNSHKSTRIDKDNIEESIKIYSMSLQTELNKNNQKMKECVDMIQNSVFIDRQSRKEMILRKLDDLEKIYEEKITKVEGENLESITDTVEKTSTKINQEIEKVVEELTYNMLNPANRRFVNKTKAKEYYDYIYNKEKKMHGIIEHVNMYTEYYENCKRVDDMFNVLESTLDRVLDEFNLLSRKRKSREVILKSPKVANDKITIKAQDKVFDRENEIEKEVREIVDVTLPKERKFETLSSSLFELNELKALNNLSQSVSIGVKKENTPKIQDKRKILFNKLDFISREDLLKPTKGTLTDTLEQRYMNSVPQSTQSLHSKELKISLSKENDTKVRTDTLSTLGDAFGCSSHDNTPTYSTKFKVLERKDRDRTLLLI